MYNLFEAEEKAYKVNKLKVNLISRFYSFSKNEIINYRKALNFDRDHLMKNENVNWEIEIISLLKDKIQWDALYNLVNLIIDFDFIKKFESHIDFSTIHYCKNIKWSDDILNYYGDKLDWSHFLIFKTPFPTVELLRKYGNIVNWKLASARINISFNDDEIKEFYDNWDWESLSSNINLPISVEFLKKYGEKLDFAKLSRNPACLSVIFQYPHSPKWNWENVIVNPGIEYNEEKFDFIFKYFKNHYDTKYRHFSAYLNFSLTSFLIRVLQNQLKPENASYFYQDKFLKYFKPKDLAKFAKYALDLQTIEENKVDINFKEELFIRNHSGIITSEFIQDNIDLFDTSRHHFYMFPLTTSLVEMHPEKINWNLLSSCITIDWSWDFINKHYEKLHLHRLSLNKGLYNHTYGGASKEEIFSCLNSYHL